jgi:hypothetical protein
MKVTCLPSNYLGSKYPLLLEIAILQSLRLTVYSGSLPLGD